MQNLGGTKKPSTLAQVRREWVQDMRKKAGNLLPPSTAASQVLRKKKLLQDYGLVKVQKRGKNEKKKFAIKLYLHQKRKEAQMTSLKQSWISPVEIVSKERGLRRLERLSTLLPHLVNTIFTPMSAPSATARGEFFRHATSYNNFKNTIFFAQVTKK